MLEFDNNYTTPEESKRLVELGLPIESADAYYGIDEVKTDLEPCVYIIPSNKTFDEYSRQFYIPAWSVGRLIDIYETCVKDKILLCRGEQSTIQFLIGLFGRLNDGNLIDFSKLDD